MTKKILFTFELEPGMIVFDDVYDDNGRLIISKGSELTSETISKLDSFSILEVPISISTETSETPTEEKEEVSERNESLRNSEAYKKFVENYEVGLEVSKQILDDLVMRKDNFDPAMALSTVQKVLVNCGNSNQVFDILHNMEQSDSPTYQHSLKVALISRVLGRWLGFPEEDLNHLAVAGLLHDIGKLVIPSEILNKSGKLTPEEYEVVKGHVIKGYELIKDLHVDVRVKEACLLHHERCDGSGYPFKVKTERITPFARILAIADVYDAMTSNRSYRKGFCPFDVIQLFEAEGLYKYDPQYILTFLENIVTAYVNDKVRLSDGREGEIVLINKLSLAKPMVKVGNTFIDLSREPILRIVDLL